MKTLFISGAYDKKGGKRSGYMLRLRQYLYTNMVAMRDGDTRNTRHIDVCFDIGGTTDDLLNHIFPEVIDADIVFWFCSINDAGDKKLKLVEGIKKLNKNAILVVLFRTNGGKTVYEQVARMLSIKANLMLEVCPTNITKFSASILDPLGNIFLSHETDIQTVAKVLCTRVLDLVDKHRIPSVSVGPMVTAPNEEEFFAIAREQAETFHEIIHTDKQDRYLGHLSFRCEHGFPSFVSDGLIFVTKRNVDKRSIDATSFVAINPACSAVVEYYGDDSPSVDSPISIRLYQHYPSIKYMMHSHVYIKNARFTNSVNPCGAIEEADEIFSVIQNDDNFAVNLKGHGALVGAVDLDYLRNIEYVSRGIPEAQVV